MNRQEKWDRRFLEMAQLVSSWSKDPSTQTGAVITTPEHRVVSVGFNGFPRGVEDTVDRLSNREIKYKIVMHCEVNALLFAGRSVMGFTMYNWPMSPCTNCSAAIIQAGIKRSVSFRQTNADLIKRWGESMALAESILIESGVEIVYIEP